MELLVFLSREQREEVVNGKRVSEHQELCSVARSVGERGDHVILILFHQSPAPGNCREAPGETTAGGTEYAQAEAVPKEAAQGAPGLRPQTQHRARRKHRFISPVWGQGQAWNLT